MRPESKGQIHITAIRSPIDGYVGNRGAQIGAYTTIGTALLSIVPAHGLWVDAISRLLKD
jgi:multidrug resistance efflux pump